MSTTTAAASQTGGQMLTRRGLFLSAAALAASAGANSSTQIGQHAGQFSGRTVQAASLAMRAPAILETATSSSVARRTFVRAMGVTSIGRLFGGAAQLGSGIGKVFIGLM